MKKFEIQTQLKNKGIKNQLLLDAFENIPTTLFLIIAI